MVPRLLPHALRLLVIALPFTAQAQLNGTYVIDGGGGGDYTTFNAAVSDLVAQGINGAVVFEVTDGSYIEYIAIPGITGSSAANTITFRGQSLDSTLVTVGHPSSTLSSNNFVIHLNGASHITFEHLTIERSGSLVFGTTIRVEDGSTDWHFANCRIDASNSAGNSDVLRYDGSGTGIGSSSVYRCAIAYGGLRLQAAGAGSFRFQGNTMEVIGVFALDVQSLNGDVTCSDNTIHCPNYFATAIELSSCNVAPGEIARNTIVCDAPGSNGIELDNVTGTGADPLQVLNNMIVLKGFNNLNHGIRLSGTTSDVDIVHNSISVSGSSGTYYGLFVMPSCTNVRVHNNAILARTNAIIALTASLTSSDNNVFHSVTSWPAFIDGTGYNDVPTLFGATGMNGNSFMGDPLFIDPSADLHLTSSSPCLGAASNWPGLTDDVDGEVRPQPAATSPDSGADEDAGACAPLSGTYLIGPSLGADFPDFSTSVAQLITCGVSGPVIFQVEPGTYTEAITFPPVSGTSTINTITYQGTIGDSTQVTLNYPATATANPIDHVLRFDGVDHVTFRHMTFERFGPDTYGDVIHMNPGISGSNDPSQHVTVESCRILRTGGSGTNRNLVNAANFPALNEIDIRFEGNFMSGGYYAFGNPGNQGDEWIITDNVIENCTGGILIIQAAAVTISGNQISGNAASTQPGIRVTCNCPASVTRNKVLSRGRGLELTVAPPPGQRALVANNSLIVSNGSANGVQFIGLNEDIDLVFNSVSVVSGRGVHQLTGTGSSGLTLQGNAIRSSTGKAIDLPWAGAFTTLDHQALFTGGSMLATWNTTNCTDLATLQTTSGSFANSVEADPGFVNPLADLHLLSGSPCIGSAVPLLGIADDMDGEVRPQPAATQPDIGADEHPDACSPLMGTYVIGASAAANYPSFTDALNAMISCGISAPVIFEVEDGSYTEQITLPNIPGNSNVNTIT
ncbi:MAG: right-handed parallel beta-helix repeat-containing protein, partial [Flavobacteriales bacterium]|nr:right-handed parallel beta-helix repeat-containing protein [Flavobacteriales bacterium]